MRRSLALLTCVLLAVPAAADGTADGAANGPDPADFALRGCRIITVSNGVIDDGVVVVRKGRIESVGKNTPDAVPKAFVEHDAQQCGFCTPGFVVAVRALLNKNPKASEDEIRNGLGGNICRCGTYVNVLQAAMAIAKGGGNG